MIVPPSVQHTWAVSRNGPPDWSDASWLTRDRLQTGLHIESLERLGLG